MGTSWATCRGSRRDGCHGPTTGSPPRSPAVGWCCTVFSTCSSVSRNRARRRCARSACPPAGPWRGSGGRCTISPCSRRCAAAFPRSGWPCWNRPRAAAKSKTCVRSTCGPLRPTSLRGSPATPPPMRDRLTAELVAPVPDVDIGSWHAALAGAKSRLADLAVRRAGTGPFRVTDHDVRTALRCDGGEIRPTSPSPGPAARRRRALGVAAVRLLVAGRARSPVDAVEARLDKSSRSVRDGSSCASPLDRWLAGLSRGGRAGVAAEAVTWATRLWCALDWSAFSAAPVIGRDRWWDSPHSALLALRGRADVRTERSHLVVLSGPRRQLGARRTRSRDPRRVPARP